MALTRIAVPIFLMISGFFYKPENAVKLIKRIIKYTIIANLVYFAIHLCIALLQGTAISYLHNVFTIHNAVDFLVFNESPFHIHLWYFGCILYVYIFVFLLEKATHDFKSVQRILFILTPFLLISDLLFGKYSILTFGKEFQTIYIRNWMFVGLPYFSIGMLIRNNNKTLNSRFKRLGKGFSIFLVALFVLTTFLEHYLLAAAKANATRDHYISTTLLAISIFLYCIVFANNTESAFSRLGQHDSTWIYVFHPIFIILLDAVSGRFGIPAYLYLRPIIVFVATILFIEIDSRTYAIYAKRIEEHTS